MAVTPYPNKSDKRTLSFSFGVVNSVLQVFPEPLHFRFHGLYVHSRAMRVFKVCQKPSHVPVNNFGDCVDHVLAFFQNPLARQSMPSATHRLIFPIATQEQQLNFVNAVPSVRSGRCVLDNRSYRTFFHFSILQNQQRVSRF